MKKVFDIFSVNLLEDMSLSKHDIDFLIRKTGLSKLKLKLLMEEPRDFDLLLDSVSTLLSTEELNQLDNLSKKVKVKLVFFHLLKDKDYDLSSKSYLSDVLTDNYDIICSQTPKSKPKLKDRDLVLFLTNKQQDDSTILSLSSSYLKMGKRDIGFNMRDFLNIMKKSKEILQKKS